MRNCSSIWWLSRTTILQRSIYILRNKKTQPDNFFYSLVYTPPPIHAQLVYGNVTLDTRTVLKHGCVFINYTQFFQDEFAVNDIMETFKKMNSHWIQIDVKLK